jgi:hypothetical protein
MNCRCGRPAAVNLGIHYRYRRARFEADAMDPRYVHGNWPADICGSAACEGAVHAEIRADRPDVLLPGDPEPRPRLFLVRGTA